jgi:hypothetical protein
MTLGRVSDLTRRNRTLGGVSDIRRRKQQEDDHNEQLHNLYSSLTIVRVIKSKIAWGMWDAWER